MDLFAPPSFQQTIACIAGSPALAASISSLVGQSDHYVVVLPGPRMQRPDWDNEVARRCNAIAKVNPKTVILAGLPADAETLIRASLSRITDVLSVSDLGSVIVTLTELHLSRVAGELRCKLCDVGRGLLAALRKEKMLIVDEGAPPNVCDMAQDAQADHVVVVDDHDPLTQIIAANYAFSIGADLALIPERDDTLRDQVYLELDKRGSAPDAGNGAQAVLETWEAQLKPELQFGTRRFATFVTRGIPYGYFYPDAPSTHLFSVPHLGEMIVAGIYWARYGPQTVAAVIVDPGDFPDSETETVARLLVSRGTVVYGLTHSRATAENVRFFIQAFPYDLLFICSHCGEVDGERVTLRIPDEEGATHIVEINEVVALSAAKFTEKPGEIVHIEHLYCPVAIDGMDWFAVAPDVQKHIKEFWRYLRETPRERWEILNRVPIDRVPHSTAIELKGGILMLSMIQVIDVGVSPIIFNNSCVSFFTAAHTLTFAGARSYVGTVAPVDDLLARKIAEAVFLGTERELSLSHALWCAQSTLIQDRRDRTYVHVGCHFNAVRPPTVNPIRRLGARLRDARDRYRISAASAAPGSMHMVRAVLRFLERLI